MQTVLNDGFYILFIVLVSVFLSHAMHASYCYVVLWLCSWLKLREYIDDTEDYINIMLDEKQNQLLQMGVMLSTATLLLTAGIVVVSLFGMNIHISIMLDDAPEIIFWQTTFGTIGGCIALYVIAIGWGKKSGLLQ